MSSRSIKGTISIQLYDMKKIFVFFLFFPVLYAEAQSPVSMGDNESPQQTVRPIYILLPWDSASAIYNGKLFYSYPGLIGDAFYPSGGWRKGSLLYDGSWYHDIPMMYDIYQGPGGESVIPILFQFACISERVQKFYYDGQTFVRLHA